MFARRAQVFAFTIDRPDWTRRPILRHLYLWKRREPRWRCGVIARHLIGGSPVSQHLVVIDGDSFGHRSYHALPKTIRRRGDKGAGAIVGFANFLLRLYEDERPRAVLVAWDTLEAPTYRHEAFADYQAGREFDDEL